jgi:hypothetical protein
VFLATKDDDYPKELDSAAMTFIFLHTNSVVQKKKLDPLVTFFKNKEQREKAFLQMS